MLREIYEQPAAIMNTLRGWLDNAGRLLNEVSTSLRMRDLRRLHIVAGGSAYYAGLVGRYIIERFVHIPVSVDITSEYRYLDPVTAKGTVLLLISRNGGTADHPAAGSGADGNGSSPFRVCIGHEAQFAAGCRPEPLSAKSFTDLMAALCLFGISLGIQKGKLRQVEIETLKSLLAGLPGLIEKALNTETKIKDIVTSLSTTKGFLYLGRGVNYPIALEGASMMKELTTIHADGFPAGEMAYSPPSLLESGRSVVLIAPVENIDDELVNDVLRVRGMGLRIIAVTDAPAAFKETADDIVTVPSCHPALFPFIYIVPLQLLAYHVALTRGNGRAFSRCAQPYGMPQT